MVVLSRDLVRCRASLHGDVNAPMIAAGDSLLQSATASRNGNSRLSASGEAILAIQAQKSRTAEQALSVEGKSSQQ